MFLFSEIATFPYVPVHAGRADSGGGQGGSSGVGAEYAAEGRVVHLILEGWQVLPQYSILRALIWEQMMHFKVVRRMVPPLWLRMRGGC